MISEDHVTLSNDAEKKKTKCLVPKNLSEQDTYFLI